jgi:hypothetical protein
VVTKDQKDVTIKPKHGLPAERSGLPPKADQKGDIKIISRIGKTGNHCQAIRKRHARHHPKQRCIHRLVLITQKLILRRHTTTIGQFDRLPEKKLELGGREQRVKRAVGTVERIAAGSEGYQ